MQVCSQEWWLSWPLQIWPWTQPCISRHRQRKQSNRGSARHTAEPVYLIVRIMRSYRWPGQQMACLCSYRAPVLALPTAARRMTALIACKTPRSVRNLTRLGHNPRQDTATDPDPARRVLLRYACCSHLIIVVLMNAPGCPCVRQRTHQSFASG